MTIVVAYTAQDSGTSALELAGVAVALHRRAAGRRRRRHDPARGGRPEFVDGDYVGPLTELGARRPRPGESSLPTGIEATFEVRQASSIPGGLLELAADVGASAIVLGSSSKGPSAGSHSAASPTGSCTPPRCRCSSPRAAIAPDRPHASAGSTSASEAPGARGTWPSWGRASARRSARACGSCRSPSGPPEVLRRRGGVGRRARHRPVGGAHEGRPRQGDGRSRCRRLGDRLARSLVVGEGVSWSKAIWDVHWSDGDLLVVGPSSSAPAARLFLGSRASKIVRSAPVPVYLVPAPRSH